MSRVSEHREVGGITACLLRIDVNPANLDMLVEAMATEGFDLPEVPARIRAHLRIRNLENGKGVMLSLTSIIRRCRTWAYRYDASSLSRGR